MESAIYLPVDEQTLPPDLLVKAELSRCKGCNVRHDAFCGEYMYG